MKTCLSVVLLLSAVACAAAPNQPVNNRDKGFALADPYAFELYPRVIQFSGYNWFVKTSYGGRIGPGPNYFSDSEDNVWLDGEGRLHLRITRERKSYACAEVVLANSLGHGIYRWYLDSPVDQLDPQAVLGLFTWSDESIFYNGEIDIEFSRWGDPANLNAQYVVQPYDAPGHLWAWDLAAGASPTTHMLWWDPDFVHFESWLGYFSPAVEPGALLQDWTFDQPGPPATDENARMNLWLFQGKNPGRRTQLEVVIRAFEFVPLPN